MPGRNFTASNYRYDFNGKESDKQSGWNTQDYGFRNYDPRLGRFFSKDPLSKSFAYNSPYAFAENDVISCIDLEGLEKYRMTTRAFIPFQKVISPLLITDLHGDNRNAAYDLHSLGYKSEVPGSEGFRTEIVMDFDLDKQLEINYTAKVGTSFETVNAMGFDIPIASEKAESAGDKRTILWVETEQDIRAEIKISVETEIPLYPKLFTPAIDYSFKLIVQKNKKTGDVYINGYVMVDGFPAYEIYLENLDNKKVTEVFKVQPEYQIEFLKLITPVWGQNSFMIIPMKINFNSNKNTAPAPVNKPAPKPNPCPPGGM